MRAPEKIAFGPVFKWAVRRAIVSRSRSDVGDGRGQVPRGQRSGVRSALDRLSASAKDPARQVLGAEEALLKPEVLD